MSDLEASIPKAPVHNTFIGDTSLWNPQRSWKVDLINAILAKLGRRPRLVIPGHHMGNVESRMNLFHLAMHVLKLGVLGDFVEVGCFSGESSAVLQRLLQSVDSSRKLHVYDSFQGVPDVGSRDEGAYARGDMAAPRERLVTRFQEMNLLLPEIHEGWFEETLSGGLPEQIAFALIDADLYTSTLTALTQVYPRLTPRGVCMFGVYCDPAVYDPRNQSLRYRSPGVKKACDEFLAGKPEAVSVLYSGDYTVGYFEKSALNRP